MLRTGDLDWSWLASQHPSLKGAFPPGTCENSWVAQPTAPPQRSSKPKEAEDCKWNRVSFLVATANVLALNEKDDFNSEEPIATR